MESATAEVPPLSREPATPIQQQQQQQQQQQEQQQQQQQGEQQQDKEKHGNQQQQNEEKVEDLDYLQQEQQQQQQQQQQDNEQQQQQQQQQQQAHDSAAARSPLHALRSQRTVKFDSVSFPSSSSNSSSSSSSSSSSRGLPSRMQALGSRVYTEVAKPNEEAFGAALRSLESAAFSKLSAAAAAAAADNQQPQTINTTTHAPSRDLSGFYQKLLGEDWEEQLQQIDEQQVENVFAGEAAKESEGVEEVSAVAAESRPGKVRQRIRRRDRPRTQDISDEVADDLQVADDEPLITADEIACAKP
ncbi:uncharacterized protein EMH_0073940 [Eimeria mitis]|uniref:Uncharacterized protein n=1 Tax=Eimeria mitis TaxID=44415 RepID=U6K603_9EIME|nr:uncharacterized protein EMH_0073940 [Eimeria mitis]CDJ32291.1 hypothetical protein, conserved [Eimeria mitis]